MGSSSVESREHLGTPAFKKLSSDEARYNISDRKLLAIYLAIEHFQHMVEGCVFTVFGPQTFDVCLPSEAGEMF